MPLSSAVKRARNLKPFVNSLMRISPSSPHSPRALSMKILIIEDDQIIANIYRNKFVLDGFEAETARDGDIGLDLVRSFRPDAVLVDLALPRVTGLEVIRKLRAENDFKEMPIVVFSNTYLSTMLEEAWKAGATKCLSKANCTPRQVIDAVRTTLKNNGAGTSPKAAG